MKKTIVISLIVALLASTWLMGIAYADHPHQDGSRLENLLRREQNVLNHQQARLERANNMIAKAGERIAKLKDEGKDTTALEAALGAYQAGVTSAQAYLDTARSVLEAKAGFDANGNMTDRAAARRTIIDAGRAERKFHLTITSATIDFRAAVREFRRANRDNASR